MLALSTSLHTFPCLWLTSDELITCHASFSNITIGNSARVRDQTPIKSRWLVTLLLHEIGQTPNISNKRMKNVSSLYIKDKFLTNSLLQNAKKTKQRLICLVFLTSMCSTPLHCVIRWKLKVIMSFLLSRMPCMLFI